MKASHGGPKGLLLQNRPMRYPWDRSRKIFIIASTGDSQPSTAIVNQLPGQLVFTQIRTIGVIYLNSL